MPGGGDFCPPPGDPNPMKEVEAEVGDWDIMGELFTVVSKDVSGFISIGL